MIISSLKVSYKNCGEKSLKNPQYLSQTTVQTPCTKAVSFGAVPIKSQIEYAIARINNPINKLKNFSINEYLNLTEGELKSLRKQYDKALKEMDVQNVKRLEFFCNFISECIKKTLDKNFGENNYIVVSVGRSLNPIGKFLSYKIGEENVKNIPLSRAHRFHSYENNFNDFRLINNIIKNDKGLKKFVKYLKSIGLSKADVLNTKKHIVITDYCCSGSSLKGAKRLLTSDFVWGSANNVHAVDVSKFTKTINPVTLKIPYLFNNSSYNTFSVIDIERILYQSFFYGAFKDFSLVAYCDELNNTIKSAKNINLQKNEKLVLFKMLDNFMLGKKDYVFSTTLKEKTEVPFSKYQKIHIWNTKEQQFSEDSENDLYWVNKLLLKAITKKNANDTKNAHYGKFVQNLKNIQEKYLIKSQLTEKQIEDYYKIREKMHDYLKFVEQKLDRD